MQSTRDRIVMTIKDFAQAAWFIAWEYTQFLLILIAIAAGLYVLGFFNGRLSG